MFKFSIGNIIYLTAIIGLSLGWLIDANVYEEKISTLERAVAEMHGFPYTTDWQVQILKQEIAHNKRNHDLQLEARDKRIADLEAQLKAIKADE